MGNLIKAILVLLGLSLFAATEAVAQYASPSFNPAVLNENPAAIAWREKSSLVIGQENQSVTEGNPKTAETKGQTSSAIFGLAGDLEIGVRTGLEILSQNQVNETTYDNGSPDSYQFSALIKTGAAAIGPFSVGFTDAGEVSMARTRTYQDKYNITRQQQDGKSKDEFSGLSLKLGGKDGTNLFLGAYQLKQTITLNVTQKATSKSDSSWQEGVFDTPEVTQTTHGYAIGLRTGKNENPRYRIELMSENKPELFQIIDFSYTKSDGTSGIYSGASISNPKMMKNYFCFEADISGLILSLKTTQTTEYSSGSDSDLNLDYGNTTSQENQLLILMPLFGQYKLNLLGGTSSRKQVYSNGEYKKYELGKSYAISIAYEL